MATVTFKGSPVRVSGELPAQGSKAPDFRLVAGDLRDVSLAEWRGKKKVLNIVPSLDTGVCQRSAHAFEQRIGGRNDAVVLTVSADLPFAQKRFCDAAGIENVVPLSTMRGGDFARSYGVLMTEGPLEGLTARAVVVLDADDRVVHRQLVPDIGQEPDYDAAMAAL